MHNFRAVCFLTVSVCLVVCVSANTPVSKEDKAKEAVADAKASVTEVCERAQSELSKAEGLLQRVDSSKEHAAQALSHSKEVAQDNTEAEEIAKTIQRLSDEVDELYATEKPKLNNAVDTLTPLLSEAETLNGKPDIKIESDTESSEDYTATNGKAAALKLEATKLNGKIDTAIGPIAGVGAKVEEMETKTKKAQLKNAHVSVIVHVATIHTILGNANTTIGQIERKKNEVSGIVGEMQTLKTNNPTVSDKNIEALQQSANNALRDATDALDSAKIAKTAIQTQKGIANEVLTKVQPETQKVSEAQKEVQKAQDCVRAAQQSFLQIEAALQTATNSVTSAKDLKKKLEKALSTTTTEQNTEQSKGKEETNLPVVEGTDSQHKDATIQLTRKDLLNPSDNSTQEIKDALINSAQNVPTTALTGGKAPAPGAKNDSAMTVSVPLLVALIASAVLQ